jgi:hypothetical protein
MFKLPNLKLYRKLLLLSVIIAGIFVITFARPVSDPCCDACDAVFAGCIADCNDGSVKIWAIPACEADCAAARETCRNVCYPQPGPECPVS